ncbi:MAG TPA: hypothetical protein VFI77_00845 [Gemmatimonadales bacterium]|nr:hypothetical protein [Gemmatimonadales bacterium]
MRTYWLRILLGALAVFAVGMIGITFARRTRDKVTAVVAGSGPLSIPLPFVPFELEGNKLGRLERLVVNREAPKKVSSVDLEVKLDDSLLVQGLAGCRLAANLESDSSKSGDINFRSHRLEDRAFFFCARSDSGLVEFGSVKLTPGDVNLPLLVPVSLAEQMRAGNWGDHDHADSADVLAERAESLAGKAEEAADSIAQMAEQRAAASARAMRSRLGDSLRAAGKMRAESLHTALGRMADSLKAR